MNPNDLWTISETSINTRVPEGTLRFWRHQGRGPKSFRLGSTGRVMYKKSDVEAWLQAQYNAGVGGAGDAA